MRVPAWRDRMLPDDTGWCMAKAAKSKDDAAKLAPPGLRWVRRLFQRSRPERRPRPVIPDVWQWTKHKYRVRSVTLLLINAALFAGLGCFSFWLRTGEITFLTAQGYWGEFWRVFDPAREPQITLFDLLLYPIPVDQVPMMMVIVGLVLATLTAIPILISMLYRFPYALIFTAIIGFVAVLPWLALTVTLCCYLARWRRIQFSFRFATAMIAFSPVVIYYLSATRNAVGLESMAPINLAKLHIPWVFALTAACVLMAIVLLIARLVNYRPGAVAPLLAIMFAIPIALFEAKVGRDELHYRLLEAHLQPGVQSFFPSHASQSDLIDRAVKRLVHNLEEDTDRPALRELILVQWRVDVGAGRAGYSEVLSPVREEFELQRYLGIRACRRFSERYPDSRYIPNALYLEASLIDRRIDPACGVVGDEVIISYYDDFPSWASGSVWQKLHEQYPDSEPAGVALLRHAQLEAREARIESAILLLDRLIERFGKASSEPVQAAAEPVTWLGLLAKKPVYASLGIDVAEIVHEGRKLRELLDKNRVIDLEPYYKYPVLRGLLSLDPRHPRYRDNLMALNDAITPTSPYSPTRLRDNISLLIASTDPSWSRRIDRLEALIETFEQQGGCDALPVAKYELGVAYQVDNRLSESAAMFEEVERRHMDSPWSVDASRRLATMGKPAND